MSYLGFLQGEESSDKQVKRTNYDIYLAKKDKKIAIKNETKRVEVCTPKDFCDVEKLIDRMRLKNGLVVDFSTSTSEKTQRMMDFLVGAVYALEGKVEKLTHSIYLMTPKGIDIIAKVD